MLLLLLPSIIKAVNRSHRQKEEARKERKRVESLLLSSSPPQPKLYGRSWSYIKISGEGSRSALTLSTMFLDQAAAVSEY